MATALDTLASQAAGAGDTVALRRWGVAAAAVMLVLCLPTCAVLQQSAWVLERCFGQSERLSQMAQRYCRGLLPGIPPLALFTVAQRLQLAQWWPVFRSHELMLESQVRVVVCMCELVVDMCV